MAEVWKVGDVVEINSNNKCAGNLMKITEIKSWGAMGYFTKLSKKNDVVLFSSNNKAYYRVEYSEAFKISK